MRIRADRAFSSQGARGFSEVALAPRQHDWFEGQPGELFIAHPGRFIFRCQVEGISILAHEDGGAAGRSRNGDAHIHLSRRGPRNVFVPAQQDAAQVVLGHELGELLFLYADLILNRLRNACVRGLPCCAHHSSPRCRRGRIEPGGNCLSNLLERRIDRSIKAVLLLELLRSGLIGADDRGDLHDLRACLIDRWPDARADSCKHCAPYAQPSSAASSETGCA